MKTKEFTTIDNVFLILYEKLGSETAYQFLEQISSINGISKIWVRFERKYLLRICIAGENWQTTSSGNSITQLISRIKIRKAKKQLNLIKNNDNENIKRNIYRVFIICIVWRIKEYLFFNN